MLDNTNLIINNVIFKYYTMHRRISYIFGTAAIISFANAGLSGTYQEGDFEEFYKTPLSTTRYPNNTFGYAMQFD